MFLKRFFFFFFFLHTVLSNKNNFLNRSIRSIDGTLTDPTTPDLSGPESNENEGVFHRSPELEPHQMQFSVIPKKHLGEGVLPLFSG